MPDPTPSMDRLSDESLKEIMRAPSSESLRAMAAELLAARQAAPDAVAWRVVCVNGRCILHSSDETGDVEMVYLPSRSDMPESFAQLAVNTIDQSEQWKCGPHRVEPLFATKEGARGSASAGGGAASPSSLEAPALPSVSPADRAAVQALVAAADEATGSVREGDKPSYCEWYMPSYNALAAALPAVQRLCARWAADG